MQPILRRILQLLVLIFIQGVLLFLSAGSLSWTPGWLYLGLYFAGLLLASVIILPRRKEVVKERSKGATGGKTWDIWLTRILTIPSLGILVVAGLDQRFGWLPGFSPSLQATGGTLFMLGYAIVIWAMYSNRYFSQVVRIQSDRGHVPETGGPYRFVRHPGYVGMLISSLGAVWLLRSAWAMIPFGFYALAVITRTALEDRTLRAELPGYAEYAGKTRYRLVPGVW
jgi:protein-S-isoprenylcysteine O-methyltransferase Ste14